MNIRGIRCQTKKIDMSPVREYCFRVHDETLCILLELVDKISKNIDIFLPNDWTWKAVSIIDGATHGYKNDHNGVVVYHCDNGNKYIWMSNGIFFKWDVKFKRPTFISTNIGQGKNEAQTCMDYNTYYYFERDTPYEDYFPSDKFINVIDEKLGDNPSLKDYLELKRKVDSDMGLALSAKKGLERAFEEIEKSESDEYRQTLELLNDCKTYLNSDGEKTSIDPN